MSALLCILAIVLVGYGIYQVAIGKFLLGILLLAIGLTVIPGGFVFLN